MTRFRGHWGGDSTAGHALTATTLRHLGLVLLLAAMPLLSACVSLTAAPRAVVYDRTGVTVHSLDCAAAIEAASDPRRPPALGDLALDSDAIRLVTWNIHKQADEGWDAELARLVQRNDLLLLQEVALSRDLQRVLEHAGLRWILASSFLYDESDVGVLTASRAAPVASCTQRADEPLVRLPKSAVVTWMRIADSPQTVAIANVHGINFILTLDAYRSQMEALAAVLAQHQGPIVLAGDLNTWSEVRFALVREIAARLGLAEVLQADDRRSRFLGQQVDHVFVRGFDVLATRVTEVQSSDHNPVEVVLRLSPPRAIPRRGPAD